jgi:hypothetical protein
LATGTVVAITGHRRCITSTFMNVLGFRSPKRDLPLKPPRRKA